MLVIQHLLNALVKLDNAGRIRGRIVVRPFANPIGLGQRVFGAHTGRFNLDHRSNRRRRMTSCRASTSTSAMRFARS
jgi:uncharacterized protein